MMAVIIDSGTANMASLTTALNAIGIGFQVTRDADVVEQAESLVLPGVGSFSAAAEVLDANNLRGAILHRVERGTPLLGICLGMQLLSEGSDEAPGVTGLGLIPDRCRRFTRSPRVPQLGWNHVTAGAVPAGWAAFANSYRLTGDLPGWKTSRAKYGEDFNAAVRKGNVLGCQFHPELSGEWGRDLLRLWCGNRNFDLTGVDCGRGYAARVIPCLDVDDGRVVKGIRFSDLIDCGDPAALAERYEAQGADEIVMLDITATSDNRGTAVDTVKRVREILSIPLTVGGGIASASDAERMLCAGADKVSVNSAAIRDPKLIEQISQRFGSQCCVLAIDARAIGASSWEVLSHGGRRTTGTDVVSWAARGEQLGAGELLLTSWDRDGTGEGSDTSLLQSVRAATSIPLIASGGIGTPDDAPGAIDAGADAVLCASILHGGKSSVPEIKQALSSRGIGVRL